MQKVVWPTTIVQVDSEMPLKLKNALSEIPVMIPGNASGSTNIRLNTSRTKNVRQCIADAGHELRTRARAVAVSPAWRQRMRAERTSESVRVALNHFSVKPEIGQL